MWQRRPPPQRLPPPLHSLQPHPRRRISILQPLHQVPREQNGQCKKSYRRIAARRTAPHTRPKWVASTVLRAHNFLGPQIDTDATPALQVFSMMSRSAQREVPVDPWLLASSHKAREPAIYSGSPQAALTTDLAPAVRGLTIEAGLLQGKLVEAVAGSILPGALLQRRRGAQYCAA